jgi:hypothetical protein
MKELLLEKSNPFLQVFGFQPMDGNIYFCNSAVLLGMSDSAESKILCYSKFCSSTTFICLIIITRASSFECFDLSKFLFPLSAAGALAFCI